MRGTLRNQPSPTLSVWGTAGDFYLERTSSHEGARKREGEEGGPKARGEVGEARPLEVEGAGRLHFRTTDRLVRGDGAAHPSGDNTEICVRKNSKYAPPLQKLGETRPAQRGRSIGPALLRRFARNRD